MNAHTTISGEHARLLEPDTVHIERLLDATPERVWDWIADPGKRARWFAGGSFEPRAGAGFELVFRNSELTENDDPAPAKYSREAGEVRSPAEVTDYDPPRRFAMTWFAGSHVTFDLAPEGDRTRLSITHRRVPAEARNSVSAGWHVHSDILAARIAGIEPPGFWRSHTALEAEYAALFG